MKKEKPCEKKKIDNGKKINFLTGEEAGNSKVSHLTPRNPRKNPTSP